MGVALTPSVNTLPTLETMGLAEKEILCFKFFHVTSQDCVVRGSCDSMGGFMSP